MNETISALAHGACRTTILRAGRLIDGTGGEVLHNPAVVMDGHTITAVGPAGELTGFEHAEVVDLGGATLLPGLIDTHVHLCFDGGADVVSSLAERDDAAALAAMTEAALTNATRGVTTVRDLGDRGYLAVKLRNAQHPGLPTILAAGPPITSVGGHCHYLGGEAAGVDGMRTAVREHAERDVDVIKIMASGGHLTPQTRTDLPQFSAAELHAAVEEAHRFGLTVTAHVHGITAIEDCLAAGVDCMEHVTFQTAEGVVDAPPQLLRAIVEQGIDVSLTLGILPISDHPMPPFIKANLGRMMANVQRIIDSGASVVVGTDAGIAPPKPHGLLPRGVQHLAEFGVSPAAALRAVTSHAAEVIGLGHRKGRLAPGYDADILAVDGDPLDDLSALHHVRAVYTHGHPVLPATVA